jgi:thiol-disulfide isomerase/thioredoxin/Tfp pilus assembly protein PilF
MRSLLLRGCLAALPLMIVARLAAQAPAQSSYQAGLAALEQQRLAEAIAAFRAAVEQSPDSIAAHEGFIRANIFAAMAREDAKTPLPGAPSRDGVTALKTRAMPMGSGPAGAELRAAYEEWLARFPNYAAIHWGMGKVLLDKNRAEAERHLKEAVALSATCAPAYRDLGILALVNKRPDEYLTYLRRAMEAAPDDPAYISGYAAALRDSDKAAAGALYRQIVQRYPTDREAMFALLTLSADAPTPEERMALLERMWRGFPDERSVSHNWTMKDLFGLFGRFDPPKAVELAGAMARAYPADTTWPGVLAVEEQLVRAQSLIAAKRFEEASALLAKVSVPSGMDAMPYYLLRAEAMGAGDPAKAYAGLMTVALPEPRDAIESALKLYGEKLGKTPAQVDEDLWARRFAAATPFKPFELKNARTGQPVRLADHKGRIVLVNFWFPGCGPCLAEFPMVQDALNKFGPKGFVVLAINIVKGEDAQVVPLLDEKKYGLVPLFMPSTDWAKTQYGVTGAPTNYLLDREGRVVFKPHIYDAVTFRAFLKEVESLLARSPAPR